MITDKHIAQRAAAVEKARKIAEREAAIFDVNSLIVPSDASFRKRLRVMEQQLSKLHFEVAVVYSAEGNELARVKGQCDSVDVNEVEEQVYGGILTHNHPDGGFFSRGDVGLAHEADLMELRAVRKGNPAQVVIMCRPDGGWDSTAYEALMTAETDRCGEDKQKQYDAKLQQSGSHEKAAAYADEWSRQQWISLFPELLTRLGLTWIEKRL